MLTTTFALAHERSACARSYRRYAKHVGGVRVYGRTTPIPLLDILNHNGFGDALWALRVVPEEQTEERDRISRLFASDCAERALLRERGAGREPDPRSWRAVAVAR